MTKQTTIVVVGSLRVKSPKSLTFTVLLRVFCCNSLSFSSFESCSVVVVFADFYYIVKPQWLEYLWDHGNLLEI